MYNTGDVVMYGANGLCQITDIQKLDITGESQEYYILRHIHSEKDLFYVPTNNEAALKKLHSICSKAEVDALIGHMNDEKPVWIDSETRRRDEYNRIIRDGSKQEIIQLIKTLYLHRKDLEQNGKKLRSSDENYLRIAENMLFEEFAYALGIERDEVVGYIESHIA